MRARRGRWRARSAPQWLRSTRVAGSTLLFLGTVSQVSPSRSPTLCPGMVRFRSRQVDCLIGLRDAISLAKRPISGSANEHKLVFEIVYPGPSGDRGV